MITLEKIHQTLKKEGAKKTFYKSLRILFSLTPSAYYFSYLFYRFLKRKAVKEVNGSKMVLDVGVDQGLSRDLFLHRKREIYSTDYFLNSGILKKGDVTLDIGANIGYYVLLESRLVGENGKVYALEPVSHNFKVLKENVDLNNIKNVEAYNLAAGEKNEKSFINISKHMNRSSMLPHKSTVFFKREEIEVVQGDDFLKNKRTPKLIRMDVGGYEYAVIEGLKKTLDSDVSLFLEIHPALMTDSQLKGMFNTFREKGFSRAVVVLEPHLGYFNAKYDIKLAIKWLTKKIGDEEKLEAIKTMDLNAFFNFISQKRDSMHVFISK